MDAEGPSWGVAFRPPKEDLVKRPGMQFSSNGDYIQRA